MPPEAQTEEEYIQQVQAEADRQAGEEVKSHEAILREYDNSKREYHEKSQFFSFLLLLLVLSYVAVNYWEDIVQVVGNYSL